MPSKGNPFLKFRVARKYEALVRLDARKQGFFVSELGRRVLEEHYQRVWDTQSSGVGHLEALVNLTKQFIVKAQLARQPSKVPMKESKEPGLPGSAHRDDLEDLAWKAVQEAVSYSKTEDAAKDCSVKVTTF